MNPTFSRVALYVRDVPKVAAFYAKHFGFRIGVREEGLWELQQGRGGFKIMLLQASKGNRVGQSNVKLVFDVRDVERAKRAAERKGLKFGVVHRADGYAYANARDPAGNLIQVSSRGFRLRVQQE